MKKRIVALLRALVTMLGIAVPASAAEVDSVVATQEVAASDVVVADDYYAGWYAIPSLKSIEFDVRLDPYWGFTKTFYVRTEPDDTTDIQGGFYLYLYNEKGDLVSYDWIIGYDELASWKFTLPSSGMYRLKVVSYCNKDCIVMAYWLWHKRKEPKIKSRKSQVIIK